MVKNFRIHVLEIIICLILFSCSKDKNDNIEYLTQNVWRCNKIIATLIFYNKDSSIVIGGYPPTQWFFYDNHDFKRITEMDSSIVYSNSEYIEQGIWLLINDSIKITFIDENNSRFEAHIERLDKDTLILKENSIKLFLGRQK
jgi:hypothetical protein